MTLGLLSLASVATAVFCSVAMAQRAKDPPWSADRINRLPAEVRNAVLARCPGNPEAGHYFATYFQDRITLHYEHFYCPTVQRRTFCTGSKCLRQVYEVAGRHYRRTASYFAAD